MQDILPEKIYVTAESERLIYSLFRQYKFIAIIYFLATTGAFVLEAVRMYKSYNSSFHGWVNIFNFRILPFIVTVQLVLGGIQVFYYYQAVRCQKKAAEHSDQKLFDRSFQNYKNGNNYAILVIFLNFLYISVFLFQDFFNK